MPENRRKFMNTYIDDVTHEEAIEYIEECIRQRRIGQVITPNVDQIVRMEWDDYFKKIVSSCELVLVDGHPIMWAAKLYGQPFKEKICGSELVPMLCETAAKKGYSVFFLGAAPGVAARAAKIMQDEYPGLKVAGTYSPPYGFEKDPEEIEHINKILYDSHADMLFVGLGVPKQDIFIYENMDKYRIPMSFSIGATIDFIAGEQPRAPKWMSSHGLEWLFRLCQDPKRLAKRYLVDDIKIIKLFFKYKKEKPEAAASV